MNINLYLIIGTLSVANTKVWIGILLISKPLEALCLFLYRFTGIHSCLKGGQKCIREKGTWCSYPVKIKISTTLRNVIEISEVNHIIELKYAISLNWYENRVVYQNLKKKEALNMMSDQELSSLWIPFIIFENTDNDEAVSIDSVRSDISVSREGSFKRSGSDYVDEIEFFEGKDNKITMNQTHSKKFHCTYLLHYFPFDTQVFVTIFDGYTLLFYS